MEEPAVPRAPPQLTWGQPPSAVQSSAARSAVPVWAGHSCPPPLTVPHHVEERALQRRAHPICHPERRRAIRPESHAAVEGSLPCPHSPPAQQRLLGAPAPAAKRRKNASHGAKPWASRHKMGSQPRSGERRNTKLANSAGARPLEKKKGADQGIDGRLYFHDEGKGGKTKQIIFSVKAGHLMATHVRDLRGVIEREKAEIGVLISMEPPTKPMLKEAAEAGLYQPPGLTDKYPRIQLLHIAELLAGKKVEYPRLLDVTFKRAPKARKVAEEQMALGGEIEEPF